MSTELRAQALVLAGNLGPAGVSQLLSDAKKIYEWLSGSSVLSPNPVYRENTGAGTGTVKGTAPLPQQARTPGYGTGDV